MSCWQRRMPSVNRRAARSARRGKWWYRLPLDTPASRRTASSEAPAYPWATNNGRAAARMRSAVAGGLVVMENHSRELLQSSPPRPGRPLPIKDSTADAVAEMGGVRRVDDPDDLQLGERRQHVEQPPTA